MTDLRAQIRSFIETNFFIQPAVHLKDDDSLLDHQVIDSTGFMELILFVESEFGLKVADAEMVLENFETIASIEQFIVRKCGA